jgi:hypothetical protein
LGLHVQNIVTFLCDIFICKFKTQNIIIAPHIQNMFWIGWSCMNDEFWKTFYNGYKIMAFISLELIFFLIGGIQSFKTLTRLTLGNLSFQLNPHTKIVL